VAAAVFWVSKVELKKYRNFMNKDLKLDKMVFLIKMTPIGLQQKKF